MTMSSNAVKFIEVLINRTIESKIEWDTLNPPSDTLRIENESLFFALWQTEWHRVEYNNSFMAKTSSGFIYLIYEWAESGIDGIEMEGFNLYIQRGPKQPVAKVSGDCPILHKLKNAILNQTLDANLYPEVEKFIQSFLAE